MTENNDTKDFITYPRTFEKYKWYKPIFVFILAVIFYIIFTIIVDDISAAIFGRAVVDSITYGGYEVLNTPLGEILTDISVILYIPALFLACKIVRDRPFSSFVSSRGGWNYRLYFKALIIPFVCTVALFGIETLIFGKDPDATYHFSIGLLAAYIIFVPLQCIAEEYVFRGLFLQTFGSWFKIPVLAIVLQSIVFTLGHGYNSIGLIEIFVCGCIFGFMAWKTNGIEVSSAMHTANNLPIALFTMFGIVSSTSTVEFNDFIISVVYDILLCALIYYAGKKTDWFGELKETP